MGTGWDTTTRREKKKIKKSSHSWSTNNHSLHNPTLPFHVNILWTEHKWQNQYIMATCQPAQKGTVELTEIDDIPAWILHCFGHRCDWNRQRFIVQLGTAAILDFLLFPSLLSLTQSSLFLHIYSQAHQDWVDAFEWHFTFGEVVVVEGMRLHPRNPSRVLSFFDYLYFFLFG